MRRHHGFSLIELLVVIGIIAILAAVLFPMLTRAQDAGKSASCLSNLSQLGKAMKMYIQEWNSMPSYGGVIRYGTGGSWCEQMMKYSGKSAKMLSCPKTPHRVPTNVCSLGMCPSYVLNWHMTFSGLQTIKKNLDSVTNQSKLIAIWEIKKIPKDNSAGKGDLCWSDWDITNEYQVDADLDNKNPSNLANIWWLGFPGPHNATMNMLFFDGHVGGSARWVPGRWTLQPK